MSKSRSFRLAIVASLLGLVNGCGVLSTHPLTPLKEAKLDADIFGTWRAKPEKGRMTIYIGKPSAKGVPEGVMYAIAVMEDVEGKLSVLDQYCFASRVGGNSYLNFIGETARSTTFGEGKARDYTLLKYKVDKDKGYFWVGDANFAKKEIKANNIKGEGSKITDSPANLCKWIVANDANIFTDSARVEVQRIR